MERTHLTFIRGGDSSLTKPFGDFLRIECRGLLFVLLIYLAIEWMAEGMDWVTFLERIVIGFIGFTVWISFVYLFHQVTRKHEWYRESKVTIMLYVALVLVFIGFHFLLR